MPKNLTVKGAREEELMEAASYYDNFTEDLDAIIDLLDKNESEDHRNDKLRREVISDLLSGLRSLNCKDMQSADNFIHAALQRINEQEKIDLQDDTPRTKARIKLAVLREKAIQNKDCLIRTIERCQKRQTRSSQ